jgi:cytochrome c oxidase assembly protein subunit 15
VTVTTRPEIQTAAQLRGVRVWLAIVALMIAAMVIIGGATRLTESGLSIVEWKPVTGTLPPLSEQAWTGAFEAYKAIPQYQQINKGMSLSDFKTIFWWEWSHRLLGRTIGAVFLLPFLYFLWRGGLSGELKRRLWLIFVLGGLQGVVGWWMVASGLSERTEVSQYRLAVHLILAVVLLCAVIWTRQRMAPAPQADQPGYRFVASLLLGLTILQMYFGALVAGLRAGKIYNTWPLIDGTFIPSSDRLFFDQPWWRNLFENLLTVQFEHRMTAYALFALALWHLIATTRGGAPAPVVRGAAWLAAAVTVQATLGILTLLNQAPLDLALTHQAMALAVVVLAVAQCERLTPAARGRSAAGTISFVPAKAQPPSA